jgi:hypothetical protein
VLLPDLGHAKPPNFSCVSNFCLRSGHCLAGGNAESAAENLSNATFKSPRIVRQKMRRATPSDFGVPAATFLCSAIMEDAPFNSDRMDDDPVGRLAPPLQY